MVEKKRVNSYKEIDITGKNVLLIGPPASGKTTMVKKLAGKTHFTIHGDYFYKEYGDNRIPVATEFIRNTLNHKDVSNIIVEGVLGYELLEESDLNFDIIIELEVSNDYIKMIYEKERQDKKVNMGLITAINNRIKRYSMSKTRKHKEWYVINNEHSQDQGADYQKDR